MTRTEIADELTELAARAITLANRAITDEPDTTEDQ